MFGHEKHEKTQKDKAWSRLKAAEPTSVGHHRSGPLAGGFGLVAFQFASGPGEGGFAVIEVVFGWAAAALQYAAGQVICTQPGE